jgi:hypothetical protein
MDRRESVTREANAGMKWQDKFHPMGRMSNHMNGLTYQPQWPPDESSLQNPLPPLHRSEVIEAMDAQGIQVPDRRLTWEDYYFAIPKPPTDPYDGTKLKAEWESQYPEMKAENDRAWDGFLKGIRTNAT